MPFPRRLLNEGEEVVLDLRPHWWFLARPAGALLVTLAAAVAVQALVDSRRELLLVPLLVLVLVALLWFVARYAKWSTTNFVLTTDRLIWRSGVLSKQGREIPLERINDISFSQTLFERLVGAGDLMIESGGEHGQSQFRRLPRPALVQNRIHRQIEEEEDRDAARREGRRELSTLEQLEKLEELRERGVVSRAEFEAKKAQLLERM